MENKTNILTDEQIERKAEKAMDRLDRRYLSGELSETDYNEEVAKLDNWAKKEYARRK